MRNALTTIAILLLCACSTENKYSTRYPCNFIFYTANHPTSKLTLALGNPGSFVMVSPTVKSGVTHLTVVPNDGSATEDITMSTAIENEKTSYANMGAANCLVIGCSNFDGLKAYDRQCPNCVTEYGNERYPLSWAENGQSLNCAKCGRTYRLNADGMPVNGKDGDIALLQYQAQYDGNRLYVHN